MKILNIMFGKKRGGIEQSFFDYAKALTGLGHGVWSVLHPKALIRSEFEQAGLPVRPLKNFGKWDLKCAYDLKKCQKAQGSDVVIVHGNRALSMGVKAFRGQIPVVGVTHNYKLDQFPKLDGAFATTKALQNALEKLLPCLSDCRLTPSRVFLIPNMVDIPAHLKKLSPQKPWPKLPTIGAMGRFVEKKGFRHYIEALGLLREKNIPFQAILAGDGVLREELKALAVDKGLKNHLTFPGWVEDTSQFFGLCDVFCLPSLHEPFGIVLLEALLHGVPTVAANSEGPSEIVQPGVQALVVEKGNPQKLSAALEELLTDQEMAHALSIEGHRFVCNKYDMNTVGLKIQDALLQIIQS